MKVWMQMMSIHDRGCGVDESRLEVAGSRKGCCIVCRGRGSQVSGGRLVMINLWAEHKWDSHRMGKNEWAHVFN